MRKDQSVFGTALPIFKPLAQLKQTRAAMSSETDANTHLNVNFLFYFLICHLGASDAASDVSPILQACCLSSTE
jgi:hypothetical protein